VNSLPKTVTRQRRDCDLNPGPSVPESSTLTTRLRATPSTVVRLNKNQKYTSNKYYSRDGLTWWKSWRSPTMLLVSVTASSYTVRSPTGSVIHTHTHVFEMTYILCQVGRKTLLSSVHIQRAGTSTGPEKERPRWHLWQEGKCKSSGNVTINNGLKMWFLKYVSQHTHTRWPKFGGWEFKDFTRTYQTFTRPIPVMF